MASPERLTSTTPFQSGHLRANLAVFSLGAYILSAVLMIFATLLQANLGLSFDDSAEIDDSRTLVYALLIFIAALLYVGAFVACVITFCMWVHRAYRNLHALGNPHSSLDHSPGWAVGFFFIPIAHLFMPYRVVKEIWQKSDPVIRTQGDFMYSVAASSPLILTWWLLWIFANITSRVSDKAGDPATQPWAANITVLALVVGIVAAALAIMVIRGIDRRQEERSRHIVYAAALPPPPPIFAPQPAYAPQPYTTPQPYAPQPNVAAHPDAPSPAPAERLAPE